MLLLKPQEKDPSLPLPTCSGPMCPLAGGSITQISASVFTWLSSLCVVTLLNSHLWSRAWNIGWLAKVQQKTKRCQEMARESETDKFINHRSWKKYAECLEGPLGGQGRMPADSPYLWHMPLLGSAGKVLWVPQLRLDWSVQMEKSGPLVSFMRVLSKRYRKRGPWELRGDCCLHGPLGKSYKKLKSPCDSGLSWQEVLKSVWGLWRPPRYIQWMLKQQYHGVLWPNSPYSAFT